MLFMEVAGALALSGASIVDDPAGTQSPGLDAGARRRYP
jgi:hypothetical protein